MYEVLALWMRYFFVLLAVVFVIRAWVITVRDNRRARMIRAWLPETGTIGEWLVLDGSAQARKGTRFPILNEGMIGSSRKADVRIQHPDVRAEHAYFTATEDGIRVRPVMDAELFAQSHLGGVYHPTEGYVDLADGDVLTIGKFRMLITLFDLRAARHATSIPGTDAFDLDDEDETLDETLDEQFDAMKVSAPPKKRRARAKDDDIELELLWQNDEDRTRKR